MSKQLADVRQRPDKELQLPRQVERRLHGKLTRERAVV